MIPKPNHWSITVYIVMFIHIKGCKHSLREAICGLMTLDIYKDPLDYPVTSYTMTCIAEMATTYKPTFLSVHKLHNKQKDTQCRNGGAQSHHKNKNTFNPIMISHDGLLQKQQYIHGQKHNGTVAKDSILLVNLHEINNSKGHQGHNLYI